MKVQFKEFFYLSNLLSLSRIFFAVPIVYLIRLNTYPENYILIAITIIAALTDILDGYFSRKLNQVTDLGIVLDPVCDKIAMAFILVALILYREYPLPLVVFLLYRDLFILIIGWFGLNKSEKPVMANFWGKLNTAVISISAIVLIFGTTGLFYKIALVAGYITIFVSGISYLIVGEKLLFEKKSHRYILRIVLFCTTSGVVYSMYGFNFL